MYESVSAGSENRGWLWFYNIKILEKLIEICDMESCDIDQESKIYWIMWDIYFQLWKLDWLSCKYLKAIFIFY